MARVYFTPNCRRRTHAPAAAPQRRLPLSPRIHSWHKLSKRPRRTHFKTTPPASASPPASVYHLYHLYHRQRCGVQGGAGDELRHRRTYAGTANETRVTIAYDSPNLLPTSVTAASGDGVIGLTTAYAYGTNDNLVSIEGPFSGSADTTTFITDANDRRRGVIGSGPDGSGSRVRVRVAERYTCDAESRITKVERGTVTAATLVKNEPWPYISLQLNPLSRALVA